MTTKEQGKGDQEDLGNEDPGKIPIRDNPESLPATSESILTGGHLPMVGMGLVPFTPSKQYDVASLEDIHFDPKTNSIIWKTEKTLNIGTHPPITTVTEKTVVKNVEEDPK